MSRPTRNVAQQVYSVLGIDFPIAIYVKCVFYQSIQLPARDIAQQTDYILGVDPAVVVQIPGV